MSKANLHSMFSQADADDVREGLLAYQRYHQVMRDLCDCYNNKLENVIATFVALSPNNDYIGNLRSTMSVLRGVQEARPLQDIKVTTYKHCRDRAYNYALGVVPFLTTAKGPKITNFYYNVLNPMDNRFVTIDGHMAAAWRGKNQTMKEAIIKGKREYFEIADAVKQLAFENFMLPNQYQAIVWFTRKRVLRVKVRQENLQRDLFLPQDDMWRTYQNIKELEPL